MAVDMFLKLDGVTGEAQDKAHEKEIDILAWSWGLSQSGTTHMGSGGGAGKVNVQDLSVTKYVDKSSATLMGFCCTGKHVKTGTLTVRKAGGDAPLEYIKLELQEILVTSISTGGSGGEDRLTENLVLNFREFHYSYTPQKPEGGADVVVDTKWDIAKNEAA